MLWYQILAATIVVAAGISITIVVIANWESIKSEMGWSDKSY